LAPLTIHAFGLFIMVFFFPLLAAVIAAGWFILHGRRPSRIVGGAVERGADAFLSQLDRDNHEDTPFGMDPNLAPETPLPGCADGSAKRWAVHCSHVVRARLGGTPTRTEANRLMVQKMCRDYMKERGMRDAHMPRHLPMAVALAFVPTKWEVEARQFEASAAVSDRDGDAGLWFRYLGWGSWGSSLEYKKK